MPISRLSLFSPSSLLNITIQAMMITGYNMYFEQKRIKTLENTQNINPINTTTENSMHDAATLYYLLAAQNFFGRQTDNRNRFFQQKSPMQTNLEKMIQKEKTNIFSRPRK